MWSNSDGDQLKSIFLKINKMNVNIGLIEILKDVSLELDKAGRLKELIIRGGQNISPAEIEEAILKDDQILDCAIVGKNHDTLGEVPIAFIVLKNPI